VKVRVVEMSAEALGDLRTLYDTVASGSSFNTAQRYTDRIMEFCERFDVASERGTRRDDVRPGLRTVGFERRVTIAFMVGDDRVTSLRTSYGGADRESML
jgi:toxin ParE1/3/4